MTATNGQAGANGRSINWDAEFAAHRAWLRTVIYARLGEAGAVDDVLQEVSLAAVGTNAVVSNPVRIPAWLYRIAVRQALLHRRRMGRERRRMRRYAERQELDEIRPAENDPLDWLLADERAELVRKALAMLPPREREMLLLKYTEHWTYRELADRLDISQSALEARLHRARQRLRDELHKLQLRDNE